MKMYVCAGFNKAFCFLLLHLQVNLHSHYRDTVSRLFKLGVIGLTNTTKAKALKHCGCV